jgi:subtilisin family serine protease
MHKALFAVVALAAVAMIGSMAVGTEAGSDGRPTRYVILYSPQASTAMKAAVVKAGGRVLRANNRVGVATAVSSDARFRARANASKAIQSVARDRVIGRAIPGQLKPKLRPKFSEEYLRSIRRAAKGLKSVSRSSRFRYQHGTSKPEPLAHLQWDMRMIHATPDGSYRKERGDSKVLVGIIDTGVDGNHPDIAPNFDRKLSRNFTVDIPVDPLDPTEPIDGPCEEEPDASCTDPSDVDENSHGTHVASTVASPINGLGMAGVAPEVTIVNLRAGQDSGFFFLQASVDALTYAGDHGVDVVNMSYFIDPWLYNCRALPADTPDQQAQQRTIIEAAQRALDYAHMHGVTLVAAAGNSHHDISMPTPITDTQSPNFPLHQEHPRVVNNGCLDLPTEGNNVITVSSVGPSKVKADYSNYGYGEIDVAAPGGWFRDDPWHTGLLPIDSPASVAAGVQNQILAAYPRNVAEEFGDIDENGDPTSPFVVKSCKGSTCAYYQWIQGTSMASPHAAGVAALIVSKYGDRRGGGVSMHPLFTQAYLEASATDTPCMTPNPFTYTHKGRDASYTTWCEGTPVYNGVYGHGIVDALAAVTFGRHFGTNR